MKNSSISTIGGLFMTQKKSSKHPVMKGSSHKKSSSAVTQSTATPASSKTDLYIVYGAIAVIVLAVVAMFVFSSDSTKQPIATGNGSVVVILEYSDFECPYCARAVPVVNQLKEKYGSQIDVQFKHFPLSFHPNAKKAAEASECARDQGKFWEYHDLLFANQQKLSVSDLKAHAQTLGLDTSTFAQCLDSNSKSALVEADMAAGTKAGVTGTPTFIIGGKQVVGAQPISAFAKLIDPLIGVQVAPEPSFTVTVIDDPTCKQCVASQVADSIKADVFPSAVVTFLNVTDSKAKALLDQYDIQAVPAFIFGKGFEGVSTFEQFKPAFVQKGTDYVLLPGQAGPFKLLGTINTSGAYRLGSPTAPVTVVEFADFECPYCAKAYDDWHDKLVKDFIDTGKVQLVFMHFPLGFHTNAVGAAVASECAGAQGKFWQMYDELFQTKKVTPSDVVVHAKTIGLNVTQFTTCLNSGMYESKVQAQLALGQSIGVSGTPSLYIDGEQLVGAVPYEQVSQAITAALN
jgi:protein-disulfide isomerase